MLWYNHVVMRSIEWKSRKKTLENPESPQLFNDIGRILNGQKIIYITFAKSSFRIFDNMIFDSGKSGCIMIC